MLYAAVRKKDGLSSGRAWLGSVVHTLQVALSEAGHPQEVDGRFGSNTEKALKAFQLSQRLLDNGVAGKATWKALGASIEQAFAAQRQRIVRNLRAFDGDLGWIHRLEGHRGEPYWPGGASGVTLDPGIDLGHGEALLLEDLLRDHYDPVLSAEQRAAVDAVIGLQGDAAKAALDASAVLKTIRVGEDLADQVFPVAARPYWHAIADRFTPLYDRKTPPAVQTVLLSLAYNRGAGNRHLESLGPLLADRDWVATADKIGAMQQDHRLAGIRRRRREEAHLIRAELEYLQA